MGDPEVKAIVSITEALDALQDDQRRNVLLYINSRYGFQGKPARLVAPSDPSELLMSEKGTFGSIGDFFDRANPQTESERVLVIAYWKQLVEGAADFESFPVNQELKNLGHPVSNITRALDSMMSQSPRLVIQIGKSGNAKQARKRYKVTREGIKRVQLMLAQSDGGNDDEPGK